jgi:hypothetical protein
MEHLTSEEFLKSSHKFHPLKYQVLKSQETISSKREELLNLRLRAC